jgi:hypothetical protein
MAHERLGAVGEQQVGCNTADRCVITVHRFGFGLLNAESFVRTARDWINVPKMHVCHEAFTEFKSKFG